jgi:hypothetical protein
MKRFRITRWQCKTSDTVSKCHAQAQRTRQRDAKNEILVILLALSRDCTSRGTHTINWYSRRNISEIKLWLCVSINVREEGRFRGCLRKEQILHFCAVVSKLIDA